MIVALLLLLVASVVPTRLQAQANGGPEVARLSFEGNESFSDQALRNAIVTRQTECRSVLLEPFCVLGADWAREPFYLNSRSLARDMARIKLFYYQRGFREARVDTTVTRPDPDQVRILFRIREGRPVLVDSLAVVGLDSVVDSVRVRSDLPIRDGDPLSGLLLDATRDTLETRLRDEGHAHVEVLRDYFINRDRPHAARVTFQVYPGARASIGPMTVVGNRAVSETVVRRMLPFREGDLYRQDQIFDAQRNLYNLDIFQHAEIRADLEHEPDSVVPLRIQVNEGDVHRVRVGGGWDQADCVSGESRWTSRNFFGGARRLQLRGRISNVLAPELNQSFCNEAGSGPFAHLNWLVSAGFTQPWLFSPRNSFTASVYEERQSLKNIYIRKAFGVDLSLTRTVGRRESVTLSYQPELATLDAAEIFFCTSFLVCQPEDIGALSSANWLAPVGLSYSRDRSDQVLNPTRGYTFQVGLEHASGLTGSDFAYNRAVSELNGYHPLGRGWVVAARLRVGWVKPTSFGSPLGGADELQIIHPQKRFFSGGSNSVRGYAQNQLGPRNLSVPVQTLLAGVGNGAICTPEEVQALTCDAGALASSRFTPRPTGGSQLLEGNLEMRFPLVGPRTQGALFLDFGQVWAGASRVDLGDLRFTPGFGVRYFTPIGPIRLDVGYQLKAGEELQVVTTRVRPYDPGRDTEGSKLLGPDGQKLDWVRADQLALLRPPVLYDASKPWSLGRFQLHLSIGQAF